MALNLSIDLGLLGDEPESSLLHIKTVSGFRQSFGDKHRATVAAAKSIRANCDSDTMQL